jgi:acyl-CoA hydrolase
MRKAAFEGKIDYIPTYLSQIPKILRQPAHRPGCGPDPGQSAGSARLLQLGRIHGHHLAGMENAKMVIAQVNPRMPRTWGDSIVHMDEIDYLVEHEEPLVEALPRSKIRKWPAASDFTSISWWTTAPPCRSVSGPALCHLAASDQQKRSGNPHPADHRRVFTPD